MKFLLIALLTSLLASPVRAQATFNLRLQQELDSIMNVFNYSRRNITAGGVSEREFYHRLQQTDSSNLVRVQAIIKQYGYPGTSLVGASTNEVAWYVIQQSAHINRYLSLIKTAAEQGELPFFRYAEMLDRQLLSQGLEQLYGSQAQSYSPLNRATGKREPQPAFIWPIKDASNINKRRKKAGFRTTVEENAKEMGISYRVVTLEEVARMQKE
ncbi:hypothetical protein GCM10023185_39180 [Hymenobacter saemangeumensis]|uniref:DUF4142 domain-containing protein n=1 Tax=Hymenobacter saemangeumensis TaxID=1084522 RepID=A0ABP8IQN9_9BACT